MVAIQYTKHVCPPPPPPPPPAQRPRSKTPDGWKCANWGRKLSNGNFGSFPSLAILQPTATIYYRRIMPTPVSTAVKR